jgi:unsaturated rhamnogalacturonyl hydrolase
MNKTLTLAVLLGFAVQSHAGPLTGKTVAVDGWHNNEEQLHYRWEGTYGGGYSEFGKILTGMGAKLRTIRERISEKALTGVDCLIIVDPDTPAESQHPQYLSDPEIAVVEAWVKAGGRLLLFGNDTGNAEFEHFNRLAGKFGMQFIDKRHVNAQGKSWITIPVTGPQPVFQGAKSVYLEDISPLKVDTAKATVLLTDNNEAIMALAEHGKGIVFALGDPWLYNEHIGNNDNRKVAQNLFRYLFR